MKAQDFSTFNFQFSTKYLPIVFLVALSLAMCGCEEAGEPLANGTESRSSDTGAPLGVSPLVSDDSGTAASSAMTRVTTTPLDRATNIGFYVKIPVVTPGSSTLTYEEKGNRPGGFVTDKSWWAPDRTIWISNRNSVMTVYAPYDAAQPENRMTLAAALLKSDGSNDILAGTMNVNSLEVSKPGGVSVTLSHLYTCLRFSFTKNANFDTYYGSNKYVVKITKLELTGADMYATADYDPYTKVYSSASARADVSLAVSPAVTVPTAGNVVAGTAPAVIHTLLIPMRQAFTADATLKITVNSTQGTETAVKTLSVKIPKETFTASRPFAPGKQYNFNIKVSPTQEMEITGVQIADWETGASITGDMLVD